MHVSLSNVPLIDDLLKKSYPDPPFICHPFVARGGITLLHGRKSLGKSPLSWELARTVANGLNFLGFPTVKGRVLFIEKDTPEQLSMDRLKHLPDPQGGWHMEFLTQVGIDLANPVHPCHARLLGYERTSGPFDLVIWNPLMRLYLGKDRDVVPRVYDAMARLFPNAGHLVISHDRKEDRNPDNPGIDAEEHSGWQEWVNLAQNVFRLVPHRHGIELRHTGSQVTAKTSPLRLTLTHGNTSVALLTANIH